MSSLPEASGAKHPLVQKAEELVCWINRWGDLGKHRKGNSRNFIRGYEAAIMDVLPHAKELAPDWLDTWREQIRERRSNPEEAA